MACDPRPSVPQADMLRDRSSSISNHFKSMEYESMLFIPKRYRDASFAIVSFVSCMIGSGCRNTSENANPSTATEAGIFPPDNVEWHYKMGTERVDGIP
jgi:hypothetical protein